MLINLTYHPIRIYGWEVPDRFELGEHEPLEVIEPSGTVARIGQIELGTQYLGIGPCGVEYVEFHHANGLPPLHTERGAPGWERPPNYYIVSLALALAQAGHRTDLVVPFREIRNGGGTQIGCRTLAHPV